MKPQGIAMARIGKDEKELLKAASEAMENSILWGFSVGAAIFAEDGEVYDGCNIESWISGLGTCAERAQSTMRSCMATEESRQSQ